MGEPESFVRGAGEYVDDITLPHMLHMAVARSPYARAKVLCVSGGMNRYDLNALIGGFGERGRRDVNPTILHPVFAQDTVNTYVSQLPRCSLMTGMPLKISSMK